MSDMCGGMCALNGGETRVCYKCSLSAFSRNMKAQSSSQFHVPFVTHIAETVATIRTSNHIKGFGTARDVSPSGTGGSPVAPTKKMVSVCVVWVGGCVGVGAHCLHSASVAACVATLLSSILQNNIRTHIHAHTTQDHRTHDAMVTHLYTTHSHLICFIN